MRRFVSLLKERSEAVRREDEKRQANEKQRKAEKPFWYLKNWNWTAIATCVMAAFTIGIYFVGRYQWHTFQDQLTVLRGQLNAIEADQRPWMKIAKIAPYISPIDPRLGGLRFDGPNTMGILPLEIVLKNVGRSPALDVRVGIGQFFGYAQKEIDLAKTERDNCAALDNAFPKTPLMVDGTTYIKIIFPGDEVPYNSIGLGCCSIKLLNTLQETMKRTRFFSYGFMDVSVTLLPTLKSRIKPALHIGYHTSLMLQSQAVKQWMSRLSHGRTSLEIGFCSNPDQWLPVLPTKLSLRVLAPYPPCVRFYTKSHPNWCGSPYRSAGPSSPHHRPQRTRISTAASWKNDFLPSTKYWACSRYDIGWKAEGVRSSALEFIAYSLGLFHDGHRTASDCRATVHVLAQQLPVTGRLTLQALLEQARFPTWRLWARDAAIEKKDILKARGYAWSPGEFGRPKCWHRDVSDADKAAEMSWLRANVMGPDQGVWALQITAKNRYSDRCRGWGEQIPI